MTFFSQMNKQIQQNQTLPVSRLTFLCDLHISCTTTIIRHLVLLFKGHYSCAIYNMLLEFIPVPLNCKDMISNRSKICPFSSETLLLAASTTVWDG